MRSESKAEQLHKMTKTAIITGASRGIGKAIAEEFAKQKYTLCLISRKYREVNQVLEELGEKYHVGGYAGECDVRDPKQVQLVFKRFYEEFGSIDVLVNNAGINSRRALNPNNLENWLTDFQANLEGFDSELATNLRGAFICSYLAAYYMQKQKSGVIINISSIKGKEATTSPGYGASKAGVIKLTRDFAKALAPFGIRVNCIAPGFINTGLTAELPQDKQAAYKALIPKGRFGTPEEIARVAFFLASDNSSYMTGTTLDVNGGYLMD